MILGSDIFTTPGQKRVNASLFTSWAAVLMYYKFPNDYTIHYGKQQYLPNRLKDKTYYHAGANKIEQGYDGYQNFIKQK